MCREANRSKLLAGAFDYLNRWGLNIIKGVVELKLLPLESPHLMKGKNVDSLHVSQISCKPCNLGNVLNIVRKSGNEHKTQPNSFLASGQSPGKIQNWPNLHACDPAVKFRIPTLEIKQHEVNVLQIRIGKAFTQGAVGVECGVNPHLLRGGEHFDGKPILHKGLPAAQSEPT